MEVSSLWCYWGVMKGQVAFCLVSLIFLSTISYRLSMVFRSGQLRNDQSSTEAPWLIFLLENETSIHQQKKLWGALKFPGRWLLLLWTPENKVDQHHRTKKSPWKPHTGHQETWILCLFAVPLDSGALISTCWIYFNLKTGNFQVMWLMVTNCCLFLKQLLYLPYILFFCSLGPFSARESEIKIELILALI